ncbi:putative lipoxygenase [Atractiella rhizophila]|nr:putative lipoxygenase [Atractiella rhizophila]
MGTRYPVLFLSAIIVAAQAQVTPYSLPIGDLNTPARAEAIATARQNFNYGPDIAGNATFYPVGSYAQEIIANWSNVFYPEYINWTNTVRADAAAAGQNVALSGGITKYSDFFKLYNPPNFANTIPEGVAPGMLSNYSSDLLFSMERLSAQPYGVRRVQKSETLSFQVDDTTAKKLTTKTQAQLQAAGRLFYVDYRSQADQTLTAGRYAAACDAYFYIDPKSKDFLPLAIRPNKGSTLIYTPLDAPNDWLLAKMLFELNDFWFIQWYHLVGTHDIVDIVYEAAVRTMSQDHPVYAVLERLAYQCFVIRVLAINSLVNTGGPIDSYFAWNGAAAVTYATSLYKDIAAPFRANYFKTNLQNRGLINSNFGPALKSFPFYEDALVIHTAIRGFVQKFVESYYSDDTVLAADGELQAFLAESIPAQIVDFPSNLQTRTELVDVITQIAYLASILHGTVNGNDPVKTTSVLPLHPASFYQPLPTAKGLTDDQLFAFMPNLTQSLGQIVLLGAFNRPFFEGGNRTLSEMWNDDELLDRSNAKVRTAAQNFRTKMLDFSRVVSARDFDEDGLSQGMPFVWKNLDPLTVPFYLTI